MRKVILLLSTCLILLFPKLISAQTYVQLPDSNAYWIWSVFVEHNVTHYEEAIKLDSVENSIIINNKKYTKFFHVQNPWDNINVNSYGLYRSDSSGRAFIYNTGVDADCILYDLSKNIGDTVHNVINNPGYLNDVIILDTSHVIIGSKLLKKVGFRFIGELNCPLHYWIEGIGNIEGFDNPWQLGLNSSSLVCMSSYDTTWYPSFSLIPCNWYGYSVPENDNLFISTISPNPFSQSTQITLPQNYHNIALAVYDLQGKLVAQQQYADCDKIQFSRNQLSNGLYFLKLSLDDKEVEMGKMVISE